MKTPTARQSDRDISHVVGGGVVEFRRQVEQLFSMLSLNGESPSRVVAELSINMKLAWKLTRLLEEPDPMLALEFVPGEAAFAGFLRAATKRGIERGAVARANESLRALEAVIRDLADDRESMEIIAAEMVEPGGGKAALNHRKTASQSNAAILGIHAKAIYRLGILSPGSNADADDLVAIRSVINLRWLRAVARWTIGCGYITQGQQITDALFQARPLVEGVGPGEVPMIPEFCSHPLPRTERIHTMDNQVVDQLICSQVGSRGAVTCTIGDALIGQLGMHRKPDDRTGYFGLVVSVPCELAVLDFFVHRDCPVPRLEAGIYSHLVAGRYPAGRPVSRLPITTQIESLGSGAAAARPRYIHRSDAIAAYAFRFMKWDSSEYDLYRVAVHYPPIATDVVIHWDLPERSSAPKR